MEHGSEPLPLACPPQPNNNPAYRPEIDGLRAIAVLAVLVHHFDLGGGVMVNGFYGVDIFFVISGYLITRLITQSLPTGQLSFRAFYWRRLRRLLPALIAMIATTLGVGYWFLLPGDYTDLASSSRFAVFGLGNLHFYLKTGYFDQTSELMPLLHTWSLGIEEQFYLVWPALIVAVARLGGQRVLFAFMLCIALASFWYCITLVSWEQKAAFYSPLSRGWELIAGALLVFQKPMRLHAWLQESTNLLGLALILLGICLPVNLQLTPGWNSLLPVSGTLLLLWPKSSSGLTASLLTAHPMRYIGRTSYSLYLWHWPVLVFGKHYFGQTELTLPQSLCLLAISISLALICYHAIEQRYRKPRQKRQPPTQRPFALAMLTALGAVTVSAATISLTDGRLLRPGNPALMTLDRNAMWQWEPSNSVETDFPNRKGFGSNWRQADHRIIVWGDSHAAHIAPLIEELINNSSQTISAIVYADCPPTVDGEHFPAYGKDWKYNRKCAKTRTQMFDYLGKHGDTVDLIVLAAAWGSRVSWHERVGDKGTAIAAQHASLKKTLLELQALRQRVAIVGQVPSWPQDPMPCVASAEANLIRSTCEVKLESAQQTPVFTTVHQGIEELVTPSVSVMLPHQSLCRGSTCLVELNSEFIYRDGNHLRRNLTAATRNLLARKMKLDQVLELLKSS